MAVRAAEGPQLDDDADRNPEVERVVTYTREAHPGEHVGHHDSEERKRANASLLRDRAD